MEEVNRIGLIQEVCERICARDMDDSLETSEWQVIAEKANQDHCFALEQALSWLASDVAFTTEVIARLAGEWECEREDRQDADAEFEYSEDDAFCRPTEYFATMKPLRGMCSEQMGRMPGLARSKERISWEFSQHLGSCPTCHRARIRLALAEWIYKIYETMQDELADQPDPDIPDALRQAQSYLRKPESEIDPRLVAARALFFLSSWTERDRYPIQDDDLEWFENSIRGRQ